MILLVVAKFECFTDITFLDVVAHYMMLFDSPCGVLSLSILFWTHLLQTAALARKNSEATRALAMQEDILEKELGEIQKALLAMQVRSSVWFLAFFNYFFFKFSSTLICL